MKKSIQGLFEKLVHSSDGKLNGGFGNIKGGNNSLQQVLENGACSNKFSCTSTNIQSCTNSGDCQQSTNSYGTCTNSGTCFA